jgi:hypothetical protein
MTAGKSLIPEKLRAAIKTAMLWEYEVRIMNDPLYLSVIFAVPLAFFSAAVTIKVILGPILFVQFTICRDEICNNY